MNQNLTLKTILFILFNFFICVSAQNKINVMLLGTYHFNNPGNDAAKNINRDILSLENQKDLEDITKSITSKFKPDQIFVESNFSEKTELNKQYELYLKGEFSKFLDTIKNERERRFYKEGETFQLAFRLAKKSKNKIIYPIDSLIEMRLDLLQNAVSKDNNLKLTFDKKISELSKSTNKCLLNNNLNKVFLCLNNPSALDKNKGLYISFVNKLNQNKNYLGSNIVSDWYKRNLIMFSNIQNQILPNSKNIFILVGTGHASMLKEFFENDENFQLVNLGDVL